MRRSRGVGFAKLNIADITGNEKNSYFSYLCTSQLYVKVGPPLEKFSGSAPDTYITYVNNTKNIHCTNDARINRTHLIR